MQPHLITPAPLPLSHWERGRGVVLSEVEGPGSWGEVKMILKMSFSVNFLSEKILSF